MALLVKMMLFIFLSEVAGQPDNDDDAVQIRALHPLPFVPGPRIQICSHGLAYLFNSCPDHLPEWRGGSMGYEMAPLAILISCVIGGILRSCTSRFGAAGRRLPEGGRLFEYNFEQTEVCALFAGCSVRLFGNISSILGSYCSFEGFHLEFQNSVITDGFWDSNLVVRCSRDFLLTPLAEWLGLTQDVLALQRMRQRWAKLFNSPPAGQLSGQDQLRQELEARLALVGAGQTVPHSVNAADALHIVGHAEDEWRQRND